MLKEACIFYRNDRLDERFGDLSIRGIETTLNKELPDDFPVIRIDSGHQTWLIILKGIEGREVTSGYPKNSHARPDSNTSKDQRADKDNSKPRPGFKPWEKLLKGIHSGKKLYPL
jgi:hypothetical protein